MINKKKSILIVLLALAVALVTVGFSFWIIIVTPKSIGANKYSGNSADLPNVAYIMRGSVRTDYKTVEEALSNAKKDDTVYIISGANPVINSSCTVKSGVTLTLHYNPNEQTASYGVESGQTERNYSHRTKVMDNLTSAEYGAFRTGATSRTVFNTFADIDESNLKNQITIGKGVALTVESGGTINIGAIVGNTGSGMTGHTSGYYSQILMDKNSKIVSDGTIDCLGYIKEMEINNGSQITLNSGSLYAPFVIYDYNAARSTIAVAMNRYHQIYPFNVFDMPNVHPKILSNSSASLYGYADLFTGEVDLSSVSSIAGGLGGTMLNLMGLTEDKIPAQHNLITIKVAGNEEGIINTSGQIEIKYNLDKTLYNSNTGGMYNTGSSVDIYCSGGGSLGVLNLSIKVLNFDVSMSTSAYYFPICWKYNIDLKNGNYNIGYPAKFLSGAILNVNSGAVLNTSQNVIFYPKSTRTATENDNNNAGIFYDPAPNSGSPYPARDMAKMIVNGETNINAGFGGYVQAGQDNAVLSINSTALSIKEYEGNGMIETSSEKDSSQKDGTLISVAAPYMSSIVNALKLAGFVVDGKGGYYLTADGKARVTNGGDTEYVELDATGNVNTINNVANLENKFYVATDGAWTVGTGYSQVTLNYNANGGKFTSNNLETAESKYWIKNGETSNIEFFAVSDPVREHYDFVGWYLDVNGTTPAKDTPLTDGKTIYAKWAEKEYGLKLIIKEKDGNIKTESAGILKLSTLPKTLESRSNDGEYEFDGWYISNAFNDEVKIANSIITSTNLSQVVHGNEVYVYARYIKPVYVTLVYDGKEQDRYKVGIGNVYSADDLETTAATVISNFNKRNDDILQTTYFDGKWYIDESLETEFTSTTITDAGLKVYAGIRNKYKVTLTINYSTNSDRNNTASDAYYQVVITNGTNYDSGKQTMTTTQNKEYYVCPGAKITVKTTSSTGAFTVAIPETVINKDEPLSCTSYKTSTCIVEGTLITLADGTKKAVEDLTHEDQLLVFNHYTGEIETGYVAMLDHLGVEKELRKVVNLEFSNGEVLRTVWAHGIFDCTLNEYIFITEENATDYVGHEFFATEYDGTKFVESKVTLVKAYVTEEEIKVYNPTSLWHMNYFASGILNVTAAPVVISGHVNYFELDENMKYDEEKMQEDIEKYGLYTYEDFAEYLTEEQFNALPFCYLKVSVGKGLITWDGIMDIIKHIKDGELI